MSLINNLLFYGLDLIETQSNLGRIAVRRRLLSEINVNFLLFEDETNETLINMNLPRITDLIYHSEWHSLRSENYSTTYDPNYSNTNHSS